MMRAGTNRWEEARTKCKHDQLDRNCTGAAPWKPGRLRRVAWLKLLQMQVDFFLLLQYEDFLCDLCCSGSWH